MSSVVVALENVTVRFQTKTVLEGLSLVVREGESTALLGPSGAGKTTLLGVINGTVVPREGKVLLFGKDVAGLSSSERRLLYARVGTVYQDLCLVDSLRVVHNVNAGHLARWSTVRSLLSLLWPLDRGRAEAALQRVGIPEKMFERTATLSGGQQQRVAIARMLIQDPSIILADEPISSLDPRRSRDVMDLLRALTQEMNKTLIGSCHSLEFARSHFDRVVGLRDGRLVLDCRAPDCKGEVVTSLYELEEAEAASETRSSLPSGFTL